MQKLTVLLENFASKTDHLPIKIGLYKPLQFEVQLQGLMKKLITDSRFIVAVVDNDLNSEKHYFQTRTSSLDLNCSANYNHDKIMLDIVIVPMVGYYLSTRQRLGYGSGFYDKFLTNSPYVYSVGVAFTDQELKTDIFDDHDVCLNKIITNQRS